MADHRLYALVKTLCVKTIEGKIKWETSVYEDTFQASFKDYTVGINYRRRTTGQVDMYLKIYNSAGDEIDSTPDDAFSNDPETPKAFELMLSIYENARRNVLGVDVAIDALLSELGN